MSLTYSKAALELGKQLVAHLDGSDDLLVSWMAHDVALRMTIAEEADDESKEAARDSCALAIGRLWQYRGALPPHLRPLGKLEPVLRTLASLDVTKTTHRYFPPALRKAATADVEGETKHALEFAINLDYTARLLIQSALRDAAVGAASDASSWVELARQAGETTEPEDIVISWVMDGEAEESEPEKQRQELTDKINKIQVFIDLATHLVNDLRKQIAK